MKLFNIRDFYQEKYKEYIIGSKEIEKHSVYLVYGEVYPKEKRQMAPNGHDEILFLLSGEAELEGGGSKTPLEKGQAVYMNPDEAFVFTALTECRYVVAGAHAAPHSH
jgi:mannose-6-phosphate isomerase-like protein (cupin superfamily)